ncbi:fimbrillin family protein [Hoylesella pleuritidis]|jgi:hypothetical protein|uniref:fimbrillin family protein n=1 Tax=Hoylesella pleuritidis TaxID=407975 RepID=UPI0012DC2C16|nr:fimbrillin family protein [Hoylesella pleuritidis]
MNKKLILGAVSLLLLTVSCSNDDNNVTEDGKVNTAKAIEFKVDFSDYDTDQKVSGTRSELYTPTKEAYVNLGNGIMAQVTIKQDTKTSKTSEATTRALSNDTYTMLAYDQATHTFKGEVTGTVTGGVFTATSTNKDIILAPGSYDFVLYNSKVTRSGNNLSVSRANAGTAMVGRTSYYVTHTPQKQKVTFQMKHAAARVRFQYMADAVISSSSATIESVNSTDVPNTAIYDAAMGTWSNGNGAAVSDHFSMPASTGLAYAESLYYSDGTQYLYFLPSTPMEKLKLKNINAIIYNISASGVELTLNPLYDFLTHSNVKMEANKSYVVVITFHPNFLYLMSDGSIGSYTETTFGGGSKTPIALVISRGDRLAMGLKPLGAYKHWGNSMRWHQQSNSSLLFFLSGGFADGYDLTWDPAQSVDGTVKGSDPNCEAFYDAGQYGTTLANELAAQGKTLAPSIAAKKWFLPNVKQLSKVITNIGFGDGMTLIVNYNTQVGWYRFIVSNALGRVGGQLNMPDGIWTSDENSYTDAIRLHDAVLGGYGGTPATVEFEHVGKGYGGQVYPFVHY